MVVGMGVILVVIDYKVATGFHVHQMVLRSKADCRSSCGILCNMTSQNN